jgi:sortase A
MNRGVGRIRGTAQLDVEGNLGIAGHRDGFFRGLKDVAVGDRIELQTTGGLTTYSVDSILIVDPDDVFVLDPTTDQTITLVTCYPFYYVGHAPKRFIVKAKAERNESDS